MCGRFNDHLPKMHGWAEVLQDWPEYEASYNRAPTEGIAAFSSSSGAIMRWGMIPTWSKTFESAYSTFNARIESVADKPTFKNAWERKQRCLIPMAGYYEWTGEKGRKQPFYITHSENEPLVVAGLFENWGTSGQQSCVMLTKASEAELASIHSRMPIMLNEDQAITWLNGDCGVDELRRPKVVYHPVSRAVGNARNNFPELIESSED